MATIELKNIHKKFGKAKSAPELAETRASLTTTGVEQAQVAIAGQKTNAFAIEDLSLTIPDGQVMVILGPSGCGKSTLLRMIAGLEMPDAGHIYYDGVDVADTPPGERRIGMVFQNYALYPQYSSQRNILSYFTFRRQTPELDQEAQEKYRRTAELMGVELKYLLHKKPGKLSGGEQQRVAIARCITRDPVLFLMDEPFSNLDAKLRVRYRTQLKRLLRQFSITTIYVTHDQPEALALADLIAIMNIGSIEQVGPPRAIYDRPNNIFVADFLNFDQETPPINLLAGKAVAAALHGEVETPLANALLGVRPEEMTLCSAGTNRAIKGTLVDVRSLPIQNDMVLSLNVAGAAIQVRLPLDQELAQQQELWFRLEKYHIFDKSSGQRIQTYPEV
jgi:ABC-type sugar transport system ATPase subunit